MHVVSGYPKLQIDNRLGSHAIWSVAVCYSTEVRCWAVNWSPPSGQLIQIEGRGCQRPHKPKCVIWVCWKCLAEQPFNFHLQQNFNSSRGEGHYFCVPLWRGLLWVVTTRYWCLWLQPSSNLVPQCILCVVHHEFGIMFLLLWNIQSLHKWCTNLLSTVCNKLVALRVGVWPCQGCQLSPIMFIHFMEKCLGAAREQ